MDAQKIIERKNYAAQKRADYESTWQEIADLCRPQSQFTSKLTPGTNRSLRVFDSRAPIAIAELVSMFDAMLTNPSHRWLTVQPIDQSIELEEEAEDYLTLLASAVLNYLGSAQSGFAVACSELYADFCAFGTGCMAANPRIGKPPRYSGIALTSLYMLQDSAGDIIEWHRCYTMPAEEIVKTYPKTASAETRKIAAQRPYEDIAVIHSVIRDYPNPRTLTWRGMPFKSYRVEEKTATMLNVGGFKRTVFFTPRWSKLPEEIYGRGPAHPTLPAIKGINAMSRIVNEAGELVIRPPLFVPANGMEGTLRTHPGAINYVRAGVRDFPKPMETGARPDFGLKELDRRGIDVDRGLYADIMRIPDNDRMTAFEISARRQQGLMKASPTLGRLFSEWLDPLVSDLIVTMIEMGFVPPPPSSVPRGISLQYVSPLAGARSSAGAAAIQNTLGVMLPVINLDPSIANSLDGDKMLRVVGRANGMDPKVLRPRAEVLAERKQAAAASAQGSTAATARDLAAAARDASTAGVLGNAGRSAPTA